MRPPRGLTSGEEALWAKLAETIKPLPGRTPAPDTGPVAKHSTPAAHPPRHAVNRRSVHPRSAARSASADPPSRPAARPLDRHGLDGSWERKLARAGVSPDFTLDLHGHGLDAAHRWLDHGLAQALALGARVVLVITGKPRPVDAADRGERRGAIRAKLIDWLSAGPHASRIAAIRPAHPRHGGSGAVYVVLRREK